MYSIEKIQKYLDEYHKGSKIISIIYINTKEKLEFLCENGHKFQRSWINIINNKNIWCKFCEENIQNFLDKYHPGSKILSNEYINSMSKLEFLCENGHKFQSTWISIKKNHWCTICSNKNKKSIEHVQKFIDEHHPGAKVISTEYQNAQIKLNIICENGHKFQNAWSHIQRNFWCKYCSGKDKKSIEHVQKYLDEHHPGAKVISTEYKNVHSKLDLICENGHNFKAIFSNIKSNHWCPYCFNKNEEECRKIIEELTGKKFIKRKPLWLNNLELDGYNEELKVAFEYQGEQHYKECTNYFGHIYTKEEVERLQCRDEIKKKLCEEHGVKLIVIPYWIEDKQKFLIDTLNRYKNP